MSSVGYKLFWAAARQRMEAQLVRYGLVKENQFGFTTGGRTDYNLFVLQYVVDRSLAIKRKYYKNLVVVAIDFQKAFDSIDRGKLVEVMVKYKISPELINMMVKV